MAGKPRTFTDGEKNLILDMASRHIPRRAIAAAMGIDVETLTRHFAQEINAARQNGKGKIVDMLWSRALQNDKVLLALADRVLGPIVKKFQISKEDAIRVLENELKREGVQALTAGETKALADCADAEFLTPV